VAGDTAREFVRVCIDVRAVSVSFKERWSSQDVGTVPNLGGRCTMPHTCLLLCRIHFLPVRWMRIARRTPASDVEREHKPAHSPTCLTMSSHVEGIVRQLHTLAREPAYRATIVKVRATPTVVHCALAPCRGVQAGWLGRTPAQPA
jgi:hypothetical protein